MSTYAEASQYHLSSLGIYYHHASTAYTLSWWRMRHYLHLGLLKPLFLPLFTTKIFPGTIKSANNSMRLSLSVVRKYAPITQCALNREWSLGPAHCQHVWALNHWMLASYELGDFRKKLSYSSSKYDRKPSLEENHGKWLISSMRFALKSDPVSVEHHSVE